jgi:hypothetical protein
MCGAEYMRRAHERRLAKLHVHAAQSTSEAERAETRSRRTAAIFMASRDRVATNARPSARIRNIIIGIPALLVGSPLRAVLSASPDTESGESVGTAIGSRALTASPESGHAMGAFGAGAAAWALVSDDVLACGADAAVFPSCALRWKNLSAVALITGVALRAGAAAWAIVSDDLLACGADTSGSDDAVLSVVALLTGAAFGLTASISTFGEGGAVSPGLTDIGAPSAAGFGPDGAGIECKVARPIAGGPACCTGWPGARTYQHLR